MMSMSSCQCYDDDELQLTRMDYASDELRTDGYNFSKFESSTPSIRVYFIYRNGIILYGRSPSLSSLSTLEARYRNGEFYNEIKDLKYHWGVFQVNGEEIDFERWYPSEPPVETFVRSGKILNDTTFLISKSSKPDGSEARDVNELYRFKKFSPKPDSTNVFIQ